MFILVVVVGNLIKFQYNGKLEVAILGTYGKITITFKLHIVYDPLCYGKECKTNSLGVYYIKFASSHRYCIIIQWLPIHLLSTIWYDGTTIFFLA